MSAQDDAKKLVDDFTGRTQSSVWHSIGRADVADGVKARIDDPDKINQGNTSLCGPAEFAWDLASDHPADYARAVIELYETGRTRIGSMNVVPCADLKNYVLPATAGINPADWILLASIRDNDNWFFDYQDDSDSVSAMTMPHSKETWLKKAGYTDVINETNVFFTKDLAHAAKASRLLSSGYKVALFINGNMLDASKMNDASVTPDHWVGLTKPINIKSYNYPVKKTNKDPDSSVDFEVYTWGTRKKVPASGRLTDFNFSCNYYGFIACRR